MTDGWIQAMDEALVTHHLGVADEADSYEDAKRKLGELIDWHIAVATDPRVNGGWQMVPVEATEEMTLAVRLSAMIIQGGYGGPSVWQAMLDAARMTGQRGGG